jgi:hypothetical protein
MSCKGKRLTSSKVGKMDLSFSLVNNFAAETAMHFIPGDALILYVSSIIKPETVSLAGYGFQKCGTSTRRKSKRKG